MERINPGLGLAGRKWRHSAAGLLWLFVCGFLHYFRQVWVTLVSPMWTSFQVQVVSRQVLRELSVCVQYFSVGATVTWLADRISLARARLSEINRFVEFQCFLGVKQAH